MAKFMGQGKEVLKSAVLGDKYECVSIIRHINGKAPAAASIFPGPVHIVKAHAAHIGKCLSQFPVHILHAALHLVQQFFRILGNGLRHILILGVPAVLQQKQGAVLNRSIKLFRILGRKIPPVNRFISVIAVSIVAAFSGNLTADLSQLQINLSQSAVIFLLQLHINPVIILIVQSGLIQRSVVPLPAVHIDGKVFCVYLIIAQHQLQFLVPQLGQPL